MSPKVSARSTTTRIIESNKKKIGTSQIKREQVDTFEVLQAQLGSLYEEMQTLVKKSPNDAINKFKLNLVNALLERANRFFEELKITFPFDDFRKFSEDQLPFNSDVLLVISQYLACLEKFRSDNIKRIMGGSWRWIIDGEESDKRTAPPKNIED